MVQITQVMTVTTVTTETATSSARSEMRSVLELLASGTIDVDEALELLIALEDTPATETPTATRKARAVHITVERPEAQNINVTIPASLTKIALKLMPKDVREQLSTQGIDPDTVNQLLAGDVPIGRLLELTKDEHGVSTRVTIDAS